MNKIENGAYSFAIRDAIRHLARNENEIALKFANDAMDIALYHLMEPIDSYYVKQAVAIRNTVFTLRRYDEFVK
jgi:hypothetical protein